MPTLSVGDQAPLFRLSDAEGRDVSLADFKGKQKVVLIFYPGDDTSGCTKQLCAVRDDWKKFRKADIAVFGVNHADAESHQQFKDKYHLTTPLLIDEGHKVAKAYGAVRLSFNPLKINRTVVGISKEGTIIYFQPGMPTNDEILSAMGAREA